MFSMQTIDFDEIFKIVSTTKPSHQQLGSTWKREPEPFEFTVDGGVESVVNACFKIQLFSFVLYIFFLVPI